MLRLYFVLKEWIAAAVSNNISLFIKTGFGTSLEHLAAPLVKEPCLTISGGTCVYREISTKQISGFLS